MDKKFLKNNTEYRKAFEEKKEKSKSIDARITSEDQFNDVFEMMDKYGSPYKKLKLTTAIDYCMQLTPDIRAKMRLVDSTNALGAGGRIRLYKDGLMMTDSKGQTTFISPIHTEIDSYSQLQVKLKTDERHNDCHNGSWALMGEFDKNKNIKNKRLVTGFVTGASEESQHLHTWIEFEMNGEEKVADYTLNSIMDKDVYYELRTIDENNKCSINEKDFFNEKDDIEHLIEYQDFDIRSYLLFRDKMMNSVSERK